MKKKYKSLILLGFGECCHSEMFLAIAHLCVSILLINLERWAEPWLEGPVLCYGFERGRGVYFASEGHFWWFD